MRIGIIKAIYPESLLLGKLQESGVLKDDVTLLLSRHNYRAADGQLSPEEYIISAQDHETFLNCISGLPELYREVAQMCYVDNLGYKEIAEKTNLPLNTVKTRINRARAQIIRKMLEEE